jgi:hypothetical protein
MRVERSSSANVAVFKYPIIIFPWNEAFLFEHHCLSSQDILSVLVPDDCAFLLPFDIVFWPDHPYKKQLDCDVTLGYNLLIVGARGRSPASPNSGLTGPLIPSPSDAGVRELVSAYIGEPTTPNFPTLFLRAYDFCT